MIRKSLKLPQSLTVLYRDTVIGKLSMTPDNRRCAFEYDKNWLRNGFSISPLELPLTSGLLFPKTNVFFGDFGIFEDSMPDGYGNYLLDRILRKYGLSLEELTPVERLSLIGNKGMGALQYVPETSLSTASEAATLEQLQQDALDVLSEKDFTKTEYLYIKSGNSGGCRPKCLWNDKDGFWMVKFRHIYDPCDMGERESAILQTAAECGITVPESKLFNGKFLGTKRFDITPDGTRLHIATASGLLCESILHPMMDYRKLIRFTKVLTGSISQAQETFRRMIFNFAVGNNDDHAKNFSFIFNGEKWDISPAYDITECRQANNGFHASLVNGKDSPTEDDFLVAAADAGLTKEQGLDIIKTIRDIVACRHSMTIGQ